jgi:hypothetical protein
VGCRLGFVARPLKNGEGKEAVSSMASFPAEVSAREFLELAEKLAYRCACREKFRLRKLLRS